MCFPHSANNSLKMLWQDGCISCAMYGQRNKFEKCNCKEKRMEEDLRESEELILSDTNDKLIDVDPEK